ncbi:MAG TPA: hypothetical protein VKD90_08660 [Gemmataceae bacterium]|nr:hypothetical protein [Gemmataceae bacterium]
MRVRLRPLARFAGKRRRSLAVAGVVVVAIASTYLITRPPDSPRDAVLDSLTAAHVDSVRHDSAAHLPTAYAHCRDELIADLGPQFRHLDESDRQLVFCNLVAHAMAPYGESTAVEMPELLTAKHLNCGNYPFLAARLFEVFDPKATGVILLGWHGGTVGAHGMVYRWHPDRDRNLFLDPTAGVVVRADFDTVAAGRPIRADRVVRFAHRDGVTALLRHHVATAFVKGHFRPSDLLYFFEGPDHMIRRAGPAKDWPTPAAMVTRGSRKSVWE